MFGCPRVKGGVPVNGGWLTAIGSVFGYLLVKLELLWEVSPLVMIFWGQMVFLRRFFTISWMALYTGCRCSKDGIALVSYCFPSNTAQR